eukprot:6581836-Pyramimonas_sp.AAC.1
MASSKVFMLQPQVPEPKIKKAKSGQQAPPPSPPKEMFPLTVDVVNSDSTRDVTFLDDVWAMLRHAQSVVKFHGHDGKLSPQVHDRLISKACSSALEFALAGHITVRRKKVDAWSKVRCVLRDMVIAAHESGAVALVASTGDPTADMMAALMASTAAADDATAAAADAKERAGVAAFLADAGIQER